MLSGKGTEGRTRRLDYDVTLIAGHREALLARTLESFTRDVFPNFAIRRLIANLIRSWATRPKATGAKR